jgi:hypothetical protein
MLSLSKRTEALSRIIYEGKASRLQGGKHVFSARKLTGTGALRYGW